MRVLCCDNVAVAHGRVNKFSGMQLVWIMEALSQCSLQLFCDVDKQRQRIQQTTQHPVRPAGQPRTLWQPAEDALWTSEFVGLCRLQTMCHYEEATIHYYLHSFMLYYCKSTRVLSVLLFLHQRLGQVNIAFVESKIY